MAEKKRIKGDIAKQFEITFDQEKEDQFFIVYEERRFPKDREKKGLPPVTIDFIQTSSGSCKKNADMLFNLYKGGDSSIKATLGMFVDIVVSNAMKKEFDKQKEYEHQKYRDDHNGAINQQDNNLSSKEK